MKNNYFLIISSIIISLILIEIFCNFFLFKKVDYNYKNRYLIYSEGKIFRNIENFFTYEPSQKITASNYYFKDDKFIEIYKYDININNLGLVQDQDLQKDIPSILFLGDSFTEGKGGGGSWINFFGGNYNNYQIINGGLLGTGFQQFELLNNYLSNYDIKKVFVLFIGDDLRRDVFQFNSHQLECLMNHKVCNGSESFYGFPINDKRPDEFLKKLRGKQLDKNDKETVFKFVHAINIGPVFIKSSFYKEVGGFDLKKIGVGNPGIHFDWDICLQAYKYGKKVALLNVENIQRRVGGAGSLMFDIEKRQRKYNENLEHLTEKYEIDFIEDLFNKIN